MISLTVLLLLFCMFKCDCHYPAPTTVTASGYSNCHCVHRCRCCLLLQLALPLSLPVVTSNCNATVLHLPLPLFTSTVTATVLQMWKGELGVRDDGQPVLQRYTEDDNILCYYLTPADTSQTIPQTPMPNLSHTTAAVNQQTPSSVPTLEPNVPQKQQRSSPVQSAARHVHAEAQLPVHDTPKAVKRLLRKRLSRAPSPRHPEVAGGTGSDACGQDPHLEGMEQEQEQISLQRCRPRKPDPPEPFPAYRLGTAPVQPKSQSAQPAQADLRNFAQLRNSVESLQPAPVKSPPQVRKAPHSLKHRLCTVSTNTAQDQQQANRGLQDQQQANTDLQASLMPALLQAAKLADAQVRAPIKPPQTCPVQAAETADQLEDESATSPAGTASPAQEFEPVPQLGQSPGGAKSPRQWSEPPGSSHDGDDLMLVGFVPVIAVTCMSC